MKGMHQCVDDIRKQLEIDTILVDGDKFNAYTDENLEYIKLSKNLNNIQKNAFAECFKLQTIHGLDNTISNSF